MLNYFCPIFWLSALMEMWRAWIDKPLDSSQKNLHVAISVDPSPTKPFIRAAKKCLCTPWALGIFNLLTGWLIKLSDLSFISFPFSCPLSGGGVNEQFRNKTRGEEAAERPRNTQSDEIAFPPPKLQNASLVGFPSPSTPKKTEITKMDQVCGALTDPGFVTLNSTE